MKRVGRTWRNAKPMSGLAFRWNSSSRYLLESILPRMSHWYNKANEEKQTLSFVYTVYEMALMVWRAETRGDAERNKIVVKCFIRLHVLKCRLTIELAITPMYIFINLCVIKSQKLKWESRIRILVIVLFLLLTENYLLLSKNHLHNLVG